MHKDLTPFLGHIAYEIRRLSLESTTAAGSGHLTSSLSCADILSVLFYQAMGPDDHFILSKGHAAPALYALYTAMGVISEKQLMTLRSLGSPIQGHPNPRVFPYVETATGSLGQGLSVGLGQVLAFRLKKSAAHCYVLMGDSETTEGSVWEAIEMTHAYKANNLTAIIDLNHLGQSTKTLDSAEVFKKKFKAFGWNPLIVNGHDIEQLISALKKAKASKHPTCIIAKTHKGYGLKSIQDKPGFHGKVIPAAQLPQALKELERAFPEAAHYAGKKLLPTANTHASTRHEHKSIKLPAPSYKLHENLAPRQAYGQALVKLGALSKNAVCLDAEVKNSTFAELFEHVYPQRFIQAYVAEQNMIGMAQGLATQGYIPFASTFASFLTRAYDQVRVGAIGGIPVRVVGSHCGVSVGQDGPSQMGLEDIALFRTLPESVILYPSDAVSTHRCVELLANYHTNTSYLRITRAELPVIYKNSEPFEIGGCHILKQSAHDRITIISAGITLHEALKAYALLLKKKISCTIIDCYSIKPLPLTKIAHAAQTHRNIIIVEDHYPAGGLGEAIITGLAEQYPGTWHIKHLAVHSVPGSGKPEDQLRTHRLDAQAIRDTALKFTK